MIIRRGERWRVEVIAGLVKHVEITLLRWWLPVVDVVVVCDFGKLLKDEMAVWWVARQLLCEQLVDAVDVGTVQLDDGVNDM